MSHPLIRSQSAIHKWYRLPSKVPLGSPTSHSTEDLDTTTLDFVNWDKSSDESNKDTLLFKLYIIVNVSTCIKKHNHYITLGNL